MAKENGGGGQISSKVQPMLGSEDLLSLPVEELCRRLETSTSGLSFEEAAQRLEIYGANELARGKKHSNMIQFLMNFKSPLVVVLMVAGLISRFWAR